MFDQVMAQLNGAGNNSDAWMWILVVLHGVFRPLRAVTAAQDVMIQQTWPIFDDDDSGEVSATARRC